MQTRRKGHAAKPACIPASRRKPHRDGLPFNPRARLGLHAAGTVCRTSGHSCTKLRGLPALCIHVAIPSRNPYLSTAAACVWVSAPAGLSSTASVAHLRHIQLRMSASWVARDGPAPSSAARAGCTRGGVVVRT